MCGNIVRALVADDQFSEDVLVEAEALAVAIQPYLGVKRAGVAAVLIDHWGIVADATPAAIDGLGYDPTGESIFDIADIPDPDNYLHQPPGEFQIACLDVLNGDGDIMCVNRLAQVLANGWRLCVSLEGKKEVPGLRETRHLLAATAA